MHHTAKPLPRHQCPHCPRQIGTHNWSKRFMAHKCPHGERCNALPHPCSECVKALADGPKAPPEKG